MKRHRACLSYVALLTRTTLLSCSRPSADAGAGSQDKLIIRGAGSTFAAPLYEKWIAKYEAAHPDVRIKYDAIGSGEGQDRFADGTVDFAGTDATIQPERLEEISRGALMLPIATGSIVLTYNSEGLVDGLKLPRDVYVDIFLGKITHWNDPRIQAANPGVSLPDRGIARVVRQDSSGTTQAFTSHLSAISQAWRKGPGTGKLVTWPGQTQTMPGNERVAGLIKRTFGAIGYVEYGTARFAELYMAKLENKQGEFITPSYESSRVAVAHVGSEIRQLTALHDPDAKGAYPIVTCTWLLLYKHYGDEKRATAVRDFAHWCLSDGQELSEPLGYVRLTPAIAANAAEEATSIIP